MADQQTSLDWRSQVLSLEPAFDASLKRFAGVIRVRWICAQAHQRLTQELRLDHVEGRSGTGCTNTQSYPMRSYAFLHSRRLKKTDAVQ